MYRLWKLQHLPFLMRLLPRVRWFSRWPSKKILISIFGSHLCVYWCPSKIFEIVVVIVGMKYFMGTSRTNKNIMMLSILNIHFYFILILGVIRRRLFVAPQEPINNKLRDHHNRTITNLITWISILTKNKYFF